MQLDTVHACGCAHCGCGCPAGGCRARCSVAPVREVAAAMELAAAAETKEALLDALREVRFSLQMLIGQLAIELADDKNVAA